MRVLLVNDDVTDGSYNPIIELLKDADIVAATDYEQVMDAAKEQFDIAFLDIDTLGAAGIDIAKQLQKIYPNINIILLSVYEKYAVEAFRLMASDYLLKPISTEDVKHALDSLRYPVEEATGKKVTVRCFGNFEIFINGKPVSFKYNKSKEVIAYLVDRRGAICTVKEISANIWEDEKHTSYIRNIKSDIKNTLVKLGCDGLIDMQWGKMSINTDMIDCDYYNYIEGNDEAANLYTGEYMSNYSWAEYINGKLMNR